MDFRFTPEDEFFRQEVREFIKQELPSDWECAGRNPDEDDWDFTVQIRMKMAYRGGLTMLWPE